MTADMRRLFPMHMQGLRGLFQENVRNALETLVAHSYHNKDG
jgi:hypothetical protein